MIEISDDAGYNPRGGWFPDIVTGPTKEEADYLNLMMDSIGFGFDFFADAIDSCGEFCDSDTEAFFEENEDNESLEKYQQIKEEIESGKTPFESIYDLVSVIERSDLDTDCLYYMWEGEYIDLYDNICDCGEERGTFDGLSESDWIDILENIEVHIVKA